MPGEVRHLLLMIVVLALVVSLDGFAAALSYGAQRIRVSAAAVFVISVTSAGVIYVAMALGQFVGGLFPASVARYLGAALLVVLGGFLLAQHGRAKVPEELDSALPLSPAVESIQPIAEINLRIFGLVIQILRHPALADRDHSGVISWQEAILLGLALALDAFGAGLGAAMTGLPGLPTALVVGVVKICALVSGWELGYRLQHRLSRGLVRLPGALLIFLGLFDLFIR